MQIDRVVDVFRAALLMTLKLSLPLLLIGLIVGLAVSLFQAMTQIQEQTLALVPKILAVAITLMLLLPTMLRWIMEYTAGMLQNMDILWKGLS